MIEDNIDDILKGMDSIEVAFKNQIEFINDGKDYDLAIDILAQSRKLSEMYVRINHFDKAALVIKTMINFCHKIEPLNQPGVFAKDLVVFIELNENLHHFSNITSLLKKLIDRYPDYSSLSEWKQQLKKFEKYGKCGKL